MVELLHQSVSTVARSAPDSIAFRCADEEISYRELDRQSSQFANLLISKGATHGQRVGIFMPRCIESVVAIYGTFKAGCVFVALDPKLTSGGLSTLIDNCQIEFLITHPKKAKVVQQFYDETQNPIVQATIGWGREQVEGVFVEWGEIHQQSDEDPKVDVCPGDAAYIMYSSGSTGQPKGITHTHASGLAYSKLSIATYGVSTDDIIANHSPINFDMSTFGYFTSCLAGATTVIVPEAHTMFPRSLSQLIADEKITIWYSVPLALIQLILRGSIEEFDFSHLRWIKYGGEPFPPKYLRSLMRLIPNARVSNVYGPAELTSVRFIMCPNLSLRQPATILCLSGESGMKRLGWLSIQTITVWKRGRWANYLLVHRP